MFFTIRSKSGQTYRTNHISPMYRENDLAAEIGFATAQGLVMLPVADVAAIIPQASPIVRTCSCHG